MQRITERLVEQVQADALLVLPYQLRQKSRFLTALDDGEEVAIMLPRGARLSSGDCLRSDQGRIFEVRAAAEAVSTAHADHPHLLARACYHLGNRHIPVQICLAWVRYFHDHVLDDMVTQLGLQVVHGHLPFEPEPGAYAAPAHHHHD